MSRPAMVKRTVSLKKDPTGAPAVDLAKLRDQHPDLVKRADKAGLALSQLGLDGIRAQAVLVLDHSGSMTRDYASGAVQTLVERALGFALQIDVDGKVPVLPFDHKLHLGPAGGLLRRQRNPLEITVDNYRGIVDRDLWKRGEMGSTVMSAPLEYVRDMAKDTDAPIFLIFVGDGSPNGDDKARTRQVAYELAGYPVFVKFLTLRPVDFLRELDDATDRDRLLDNIDAQDVPDPKGISDLDFARLMVEEWDTWIKLATDKGVLS